MAYKLQFGGYVLPRGFYPVRDELVYVVPHAKLPRWDGARAIRGSLDARRLSIKGGLSASVMKTGGLTTIQGTLDTMLAALIANAPASVYFGRDDRYLRNVQIERFPQEYDATWFGRLMEVEIGLLATDPFYYDVTSQTDNWTVTATGQNRTITTPSMSAYALPVYSITVGGVGAQTIAFTILNQTTGKSFTLSGSVTGGDVIVVDSLNQTVTIGGVDKMSLFDGVWVALLNGANVFVEAYTSGSITTISTVYAPRYY